MKMLIAFYSLRTILLFLSCDKTDTIHRFCVYDDVDCILSLIFINNNAFYILAALKKKKKVCSTNCRNITLQSLQLCVGRC